MPCTDTVYQCCICNIVLSDYAQNYEVYIWHPLLSYLTMHWLHVSCTHLADGQKSFTLYVHRKHTLELQSLEEVKMCDNSVMIAYSSAVEMPWPTNLQKRCLTIIMHYACINSRF